MKEKRNTVQKELVRKLVLSSKAHPTAESIYASARSELPSISLGTVYRILHALAEAGEIVEVPVSGAPSRFDSTNCSHAHMVCEKCGGVFDVPLDVDAVLKAAGSDCAYRLDSAHITFGGVCDKCAESEICGSESAVN